MGGLEIAEIRRESRPAKATGQRPAFNEILTWAPDRLSRNAGDLGKLVDLMDEKLIIEIRTFSQRFSNSPDEKFLLMILGSQAKLENGNRGVNVRRGLRMHCEMGLRPDGAPTGYLLNEKRTDRKYHAIIDPERAPIIKKMFEKVVAGKKIIQQRKSAVLFYFHIEYLGLANVISESVLDNKNRWRCILEIA